MKAQARTLVPVATLLLWMGVAFAHGDKKHDEGEEEDAMSEKRTAEDSIRIDSVYTAIQEGFSSLESVFRKGCFDCHTSETNYPWYHVIPGVQGMIDGDIAEAKEHLDMSAGFPFGGHGKPVDDLVAVKHTLEEGDMPPFFYRMMHWSAKPSDEERKEIFIWIDSSLISLATVGIYPTDPQADGSDSLSQETHDH